MTPPISRSSCCEAETYLSHDGYIHNCSKCHRHCDLAPVQEKGEEVIKDIFNGILENAEEENRADPLYLTFQKAIKDDSLLSLLEFEMMRAVLVATRALEDSGMKVNNEQFTFLLGLPRDAHTLEKEIRENEGSVCCVDKTYSRLNKKFKELVNTPSKPQTPSPNSEGEEKKGMDRSLQGRVKRNLEYIKKIYPDIISTHASIEVLVTEEVPQLLNLIARAHSEVRKEVMDVLDKETKKWEPMDANDMPAYGAKQTIRNLKSRLNLLNKE